MEKQTMGAFIAALRKSNGLTQRELAEKLNVSDKAVSRWERDESLPDLMLIPLIADIFGVTSDELLRGERRKPTDVALENESESRSTRKRLDILLKRLRAKHTNQSIISAGLAVFGLAAAAIANLGFLRSYLAFGLCCAFVVAALICQTIFTNNALSAADTDEFEGAELSEFRRDIKLSSLKIYSVILLVFVFCCPLAFTGDTYLGLSTASWLYSGAAAAAVLAVLLVIISSAVIVKGGKSLTFSEKQKKNAVLKLKIAVIFTVTVAVSILGLMGMNDYRYQLFAKGQSFDNKDTFIEFMKTYRSDSNENTYRVEVIDGNEDDLFEDMLMDRYGNVVFTYPYNEDVSSIEFGNEENDYLPITVHTAEDSGAADSVVDVINTAFIAVFIAEAALPFIIYFKKREK